MGIYQFAMLISILAMSVGYFTKDINCITLNGFFVMFNLFVLANPQVLS